MEQTPIPKLLLKLSPPVMLALLIQSIYNIVDSYFIAKYSPQGLTALSIIFPIQLLMTALATGTGNGINILIARADGSGEIEQQKNIVKSGLWLGVINFLIFSMIGLLSIKGYYRISSGQTMVRELGVRYAQIVFLFSLGQFLDANATKMLQAKGDMVTPMTAQIVGAVVNVVLDPIFIFGLFGAPEMGIAGAAIATVIGQWIAMLIVLAAVRRKCPLDGTFSVKNCLFIYRTGFPSMMMQSLCTLYIVGLNLILKEFTEDAVTVLGIYYKLQTFFFIPLFGLQQVILPVISYSYGAKNYNRAKETFKYSAAVSCGIMLVGVFLFMLIPGKLLAIFSNSPAIAEIGSYALRVISLSFVPAGIVIMGTVFFQGMNCGKLSIFITVLRQVLLLVPLAWVFHFWGLSYVWLTFPVTEVIAASCCIVLYYLKIKNTCSVS